ncbi:hypothetical protein FQN54_009496 [Arachnomyces sp. PD_36]|nr:hypothetical protein FQN54_009496 [Arachnomyces sp. PD_36]
MGFSHVGISVPPSKFDETLKFYLRALAPLGYKEILRPQEQVVGLGVYGPTFWITAREDTAGEQHVHIAFDASNYELIHKFYDAALKAGGRCNGKPGPRSYTKHYYGAFVLDPVGNNIEALSLWPAWSHWKYWFGLGIFSREASKQD